MNHACGLSPAEVDYVPQCGRGVVPVEVKAGKSGTLRSLRRMMDEKRLPRAVRSDANPRGLQKIPRTDGTGWGLESPPLRRPPSPSGRIECVGARNKDLREGAERQRDGGNLATKGTKHTKGKEWRKGFECRGDVPDDGKILSAW